MTDYSVIELPIRGLDSLFSPPGLPLVDKGALRPTTSLAVIGDAGAGKTTLAVAVAHAVARALGGVGLYITTELASAEIAYKTEFLGLEHTQVLRPEDRSEAKPGDIIAAHLVLLDALSDVGATVQERALQAALDLTGSGLAGLPVACVVIDAFPMSGTGHSESQSRDKVVGLVQILEGRGVSVVVVQEDGGAQQYLPFVVDIVLDLSFERDPTTGELGRKVSCKKSRYTQSLPGPHDAGTDFGRPAIWPNPLAVAVHGGNRLGIDIDPLGFFVPLAGEQVSIFRGGALLVSPYEVAGDRLLALLRKTPGIRTVRVDCGPLTFLRFPPGRPFTVPHWEGPYSLGWALVGVCRETKSNAVLIQNLEWFLTDPTSARKVSNALAALVRAGIVVCVHGELQRLESLIPSAHFVWGGKCLLSSLTLTRHRNAANWLALESWPVVTRPTVENERVALANVRGAVRRLKEFAKGGDIEGAKRMLDAAQPPVEAESTLVARAHLALGYYLIGASESAEQGLHAVGTAPVTAAVSNAWSAALMGLSWRAATELREKLPDWSPAGDLLWASLVALHAGNNAGLDVLRASAEREPAVLPLLFRALAVRLLWDELDQRVHDACIRFDLPVFFPDRIRADARLEVDDPEVWRDAERRFQELADNPQLPKIHHADAWYNLGVARASLGLMDSAIQCWERALAANPLLDSARKRLAERSQATYVSDE